jgi:SGNH domain (fused to AT3 domains)
VGQPAHPCVYGSPKPRAIRVALIGDSHAAALLAVLEPQLDALHWRVTAYTGQTCAWLPARLAPQCRGLPQVEQALLDRRYAVVIATELRQYANPVAQHLAAMKPVAATGTHIVVVEDDPGVSPASTACVTRLGYSATGDCGTPATVAFRDPDRLAQAAAQVPGARVVSTARFFCRDGFCPATIGNVIVYRDTAAHVTASYARTLSPYLVEAIERVLPPALR